MTTQSITRSLVQLKQLTTKIDAAILNGKFVSKTVGKNQYRKVVGANDSVEAMTVKIRASFDTVDSLINLREKIKSAIVISNATTRVKIMGKEMFVCEAIELKSTVGFRTNYLNQLRAQFTQETTQVDKANLALDVAIETSMNAIYGSEKTKVSEDSFKAVANPQKEQKEVCILDPQKIESRIEKLTQDIADITCEIDFVLSESNAVTTIDV